MRSTFDQDLHRLFFGGVAENFVGLHDIGQGEVVCDELARIQLAGEDGLQQHGS